MVNNQKIPRTGRGAPQSEAPFLSLSDDALLAQCAVDHYRSSGPGGQKRNKTSSAVRLRHEPTEISATATEHRSQHVNLVYALRRLREAIALERRGNIDLDTYSPSNVFRECVSDGGSFRVNPRDPKYPIAVSEILDVFQACQMAVAKTGEYLELSTGQMVKLLRADPKTWKQANQMRASMGLKPLRS